MYRIVAAIALLVLVCGQCQGYPDGPPELACVNMQPGTKVGPAGTEGHTAVPQNDLPTYGNRREPPYYIQIHLPEPFVYSPGQEIKGLELIQRLITGISSAFQVDFQTVGVLLHKYNVGECICTSKCSANV